jgi:hypothetical protein
MAIKITKDKIVHVSITETSPVQGSLSGYTSGGNASGNSYADGIDKFPFATDENATDVGNLSVGRRYIVGHSSLEYGYSSGGGASPDANALKNIIDKFSFAVDGDATDVGDLSQERESGAGQSSKSSGYTSGGIHPSNNPIRVNTIDKFSFAADGNATDVGDLTQGRSSSAAGQSSFISGYTSGGLSGPPNIYDTTIDKFPFAADGNATDVGDLSVGRTVGSGQSSESSGYSSGGFGGAANTNTIDKFSFAADGDATDVGDLTNTPNNATGQSSIESGYSSGGQAPSYSNVIQKFPFASDANATDVGNLTFSRRYTAGQQV